MDDISFELPAVLQLRKLKDYKAWSVKAYPREVGTIPLFYTPQFGQKYPLARPLHYLEAFTHTPWYITFGFWMSIFTYRMIDNYSIFDVKLFGLGVVGWTLAEYILHRFVFHNAFCNEHIPEITFLLHYNHHKVPHGLSRLSTPFLLTGPFYFIMVPLVFLLGFICYDILHYSTHALLERKNETLFTDNAFLKPLRFIQRHHMIHHVLPEQKYGFTTPIWDYIFGTN